MFLELHPPARCRGCSRVLGLTDFPIYIVDDGVGYTVKPNQAGNFMIVNGWSFNDRGMGTSRAWNPNLKENILLVGNSIIMGGNPYRQEEKIGPLLEHLLAERYSVWPIAVGGWTNVNEAAVLERNKDVVSDSQFIIVEYMNGGFSSLSRWPGEYVFPINRPSLATWFLLRKYVLPILDLRIFHLKNELPPIGPPVPENVERFEQILAALKPGAHFRRRGILFLYPARSELLRKRTFGQEWLVNRPLLTELAQRYDLMIIDIAERPEWNELSYRTAFIRP